MNINPRQINEMCDAGRPLVEWFNKNLPPYCHILIDIDSITLIEDVVKIRVPIKPQESHE